MMNRDNTRVVFLIDVAMGRMVDSCKRKTLGRAITLTSIRALLFLSKFPHPRYKDILKWNYTFYDSQQADWSLRSKSGNFLELSSCQLESYSHDIFSRLDSSTIKCVKATQPSVSLLYNAIGAAVQDYPWDAPFVVSPVRLSKSSKKNSRRCSIVEKEQSNILFVFNYCPTSKEDLQAFCNVKHTNTEITMDTIKSKLFTEDLCSSVMKKNVKIYFINCNDIVKQSKSKDLYGLLLYSDLVSKSVSGKVLQLSQFISPAYHRVLHQSFSSLDCHGDLLKQKESPTDGIHEPCHSTTNKEGRKSLCTLTYPIQTTLSTVDITDSSCTEPQLLKLSEDGEFLCILSVSPMLRDSPSLQYSNHSPSSSSELGGPVEAEVTGVIKITDINLSWFHPTKLYTCVSIGNDELRCSRYFQTLNLWLASNKCALMIKITAANESALLQPITSLVSSCTFVKPECVMSLSALPSTSLAENRLVVQADGDAPCSSKQLCTDSNLFPMEVDFCVNLDRLFSPDCTTSIATGESQSLLLQSFHPCSLSLPAGDLLTREFYSNLCQLAKTEESNYSNSVRTFQQSLYTSNQEDKTDNDGAIEHDQATTCVEPVLSQAQAIDWFKSLYQQCVESNDNEEELFKSLTEAVKKLEDILSSDELLRFLDQNMLLTHTELRAKHEAADHVATEKRKINEYQLQTLLYLEAHRRGLRDHVTVAEQLVLLLRGISLMTDTLFLSRYLTETLLANYLNSCPDALRLLYEELMLPLPVQLSSPTLDTSFATSDGESPFCTTKPLIAASAVEDNSSSRKLKRFKSFHGFPAAKKQITVPVGKKPKKVSKDNRHNPKSSTARSTFKSVRSPFKSPLEDRIGGNNVRRSLFARSKSMISISHLSTAADTDAMVHSIDDSQEASHRGIKVDNIVRVQETPLKKQVSNYQQFKLQRTRSKLGKARFPEVNSIEESPYRELQSMSGRSGFPRRSTGCKREVISSSSGDDEDCSETPDALLSLYLPPPADDDSSKDLHLFEEPTDSMVAFRLATPPKEARLNFVNVTTSLNS